jgi:RNA polymerase sigma factor (sigma-70 family)
VENEHRERLSDEFELRRDYLRKLALGILGSRSDADDAVQETWLRLARSDARAITNPVGWLTTVTSRVSLDMLRARRARPMAQSTADVAECVASLADDPEREALMADTIGDALAVLLSTLRPPERLAFVLHDVFAFHFEDIGAILGRSPAATKQLASRARAKIQGRSPVVDERVRAQREVVEAFLAASRQGDFNALLTMLDPDVTLAADAGVERMGVPSRLSGAAAIAGLFSGRAQAAEPALVDGQAGLVWIVGARPRVVWDFVVEGGRIAHINMLATADTLAILDLEPLR